MEILKNFFSGLKERLSSPFFISFFITLVVFNYRIVIPLLFYKHEDLWLDNYWTYVDMIQQLNDADQIFYLEPLICSAIFSIVYPVFTAVFEYFQARVAAIKDDKTFNAIGPLKAVSVEDHKKEVQKLEEEKAEYARLIQTQGATEATNIHLKTELKVSTDNIDQLKKVNTSLTEQLAMERRAREQADKLKVAETLKLVDAMKQKFQDDKHIEKLNLHNSELKRQIQDLQSELLTLTLKTGTDRDIFIEVTRDHEYMNLQSALRDKIERACI